LIQKVEAIAIKMKLKKILQGACPHGFGLWRLLRDDGAHSHPPGLTRRAPGCPLEFGSGKPVFPKKSAGKSPRQSSEPPRLRKKTRLPLRLISLPSLAQKKITPPFP